MVPPAALHRFHPVVGCIQQGVQVGMTNLSFLQASVLRLLIAMQAEVELGARFSVFSVVCLSISPAVSAVCENRVQSSPFSAW